MAEDNENRRYSGSGGGQMAPYDGAGGRNSIESPRLNEEDFNSLGLCKSICGAVLTLTLLLIQFWVLATFAFIGAMRGLYYANTITKIISGGSACILIIIILIDRRKCNNCDAPDRPSASTDTIRSEDWVLKHCAAEDFIHHDHGDHITNRGPHADPHQHQFCDGKYQSPINIDKKLVFNVTLPRLQLVGFAERAHSAEIVNNGHTAKVTMVFKKRSYMAGGPLEGIYDFSQFHFHWGANNKHGSEDLINNHSYPMEIHFVFFKEKYKNFENALHFKDGVSVIAGFYKISKTPNPKLNVLTSLLDSIVQPNTKAAFKPPPSLMDFLPEDLVHYYSYNGSLTTPPCNEVVIWIEFAQPIPIAAKQLEHFRHIHNLHNKSMKENARHVQPLNGRKVFFNIK